MNSVPESIRIVADSAIPFVRPLFGELGRLELVDAGRLDRDVLTGADALLVRTVTRVDADLLEGTGVKFVGTASSGTDHVDRDWLTSKDIDFADAGGCNARAVCEYVLSCLFALSQLRGLDLAKAGVGIIGAGHVGSLLAAILAPLGIPCLLNDPPLAEKTGDSIYRPLEALLDLEVLTFHVALAEEGAHPTRNMLNDTLLARLRPDVCLINTSRGAICDEAALARFIDAHPRAATVVDVWTGEPALNIELLRRVAIGTAHIAGYSLDAKLRATRMIRDAFCRSFSLEPIAVPEPHLPAPPGMDIPLAAADTDLEAVQLAVLASYDVRTDAAQLHGFPAMNKSDRRDNFVNLRENYPFRREFPARRVVAERATPSLQRKLRAVGFQVTGAT